MEKKNRNIVVALATVLAGGAFCAAVAAVRWCSVCCISGVTLAGTARAEAPA